MWRRGVTRRLTRTLMSALWSVEYQRKGSDTKECLWVSVAEPKSMARADRMRNPVIVSSHSTAS